MEIVNSAALKIMQNVMKGEAEKAGFKSPDDVVKYIKDMRKGQKNNYGNNGRQGRLNEGAGEQ
jgi:hypothetical protein